MAAVVAFTEEAEECPAVVEHSVVADHPAIAAVARTVAAVHPAIGAVGQVITDVEGIGAETHTRRVWAMHMAGPADITGRRGIRVLPGSVRQARMAPAEEGPV